MTFFEGLVISNMFLSLIIAYNLGKVQSDMEIVYEGLAQAMLELDMRKKSD